MLLLHLLLYAGVSRCLDPDLSSLEGRYNYASFDCAARILATNPGAKSATSILQGQKDTYLRNLCSYPEQWVVMELCQDIRVDTVLLANYEFFSSTFKDVEVWLAKRYPPSLEDGWRLLGRWTAENRRGDQIFRPSADSPLSTTYTRFLKLVIRSHYGSEYYCPVSLVRVFGRTMIDDWAEEEEAAGRRESRKRQREITVVVMDEEPKSMAKESMFKETMVKETLLKETMELESFGKHCRRKDSVFSRECPIKKKTTPSAKMPQHALQISKKINDQIIAVPSFPVPMNPIRRTVIYQLVCPHQNPLQHHVCSSRVKSVVVVEGTYNMDPDRIIISDDDMCHTGKGGKKHENIFKSLSDRLEALEKAQSRHSTLLTTSFHRSDFHLSQLLSDTEATRHALQELRMYVGRVEEGQAVYVEGRVGRAEREMAEDVLELAGRIDRLFEWILCLLACNIVIILAIIYLLVWKSRRPNDLTFTLPPAHIRTDSFDQAVDSTLMEASPLLLFDPEPSTVDGIYGQPSPIDSSACVDGDCTGGGGESSLVDTPFSAEARCSDVTVPNNDQCCPDDPQDTII